MGNGKWELGRRHWKTGSVKWAVENGQRADPSLSLQHIYSARTVARNRYDAHPRLIHFASRDAPRSAAQLFLYRLRKLHDKCGNEMSNLLNGDRVSIADLTDFSKAFACLSRTKLVCRFDLELSIRTLLCWIRSSTKRNNANDVIVCQKDGSLVPFDSLFIKYHSLHSLI